MRLLDELIARAQGAGEEGIGADDAFLPARHVRLPDRPDARAARPSRASASTRRASRSSWTSSASARASSAGRGGARRRRDRIARVRGGAGTPTTFTGYETLEQATAVGAVAREDGRVLAKLAESPFYATGGGQVADGGVIECESGDCRARVADVVRLGDDQALVLEPLDGRAARGRARHRARDPDAPPDRANHTATHLLHAALRERAGHPRAPGRLVRRAGQAALRLHPRRGADRRRAARRRGRGERADRRGPAGARADDDARRGARPRRDGAVRREVRRRRADGRDRRRQLVARAVRRHARALAPRRSAS